jgi:helix-turn-helix resolvase-like protein
VDQHKFERIDKGQKRSVYPKTRTKLSNGKTIRERDAKGRAVSLLNDENDEVIAEALQRYVNGESVQDVCKDLNVSRGTIYNWMLADLGPEKYKTLVRKALAAKIRRGDEMLETAPDPLNMSRGREMAKFARQDFERRCPDIYGQKQEVKHTGNLGPLINIQLSGSASSPTLIQPESSMESVEPLDPAVE